jgi:hypothetical protein
MLPTLINPIPGQPGIFFFAKSILTFRRECKRKCDAGAPLFAR